MHRAASFNPAAHPRRAAAIRERELGALVKAYGSALTSIQIAARIGISRMEAEQLAARHGVAIRETVEY